MKIISSVNQKGGVGKTTTSLNLASALAETGKRVLVVDLDPQRNATTTLNGDVEYTGQSISDLIYFAVRGLPINITEYIRYNESEGIDYIPSVPALSSVPSFLATDRDSGSVLARLLRTPYFEKYDYIIIDCKPSLDLLVTNALAASDEIIIPVEPEDYAIDGLADLMDTVHRIQDRYNEQLAVNGILISRANMTRGKAKRTEAMLRENFGESVFDTVIPNLAEIGNAKDKGFSTLKLKGSRLGDLYRQLAKEVMERDEQL